MTDSNHKVLVDAITRLLSRREHAYVEVIRKLQQKGFDVDSITSVLDAFRDADIQSDARYAEMKVRAAIAKGQGPGRIKQDCHQWQVDERVVEQAMAENVADWFDVAWKVRVKKFGNEPVKDRAQRFKIMRFLHYRGFSQDQIGYALSEDEI